VIALDEGQYPIDVMMVARIKIRLIHKRVEIRFVASRGWKKMSGTVIMPLVGTMPDNFSVSQLKNRKPDLTPCIGWYVSRRGFS